MSASYICKIIEIAVFFFPWQTGSVPRIDIMYACHQINTLISVPAGWVFCLQACMCQFWREQKNTWSEGRNVPGSGITGPCARLNVCCQMWREAGTSVWMFFSRSVCGRGSLWYSGLFRSESPFLQIKFTAAVWMSAQMFQACPQLADTLGHLILLDSWHF